MRFGLDRDARFAQWASRRDGHHATAFGSKSTSRHSVFSAELMPRTGDGFKELGVAWRPGDILGRAAACPKQAGQADAPDRLVAAFWASIHVAPNLLGSVLDFRRRTSAADIPLVDDFRRRVAATDAERQT